MKASSSKKPTSKAKVGSSSILGDFLTSPVFMSMKNPSSTASAPAEKGVSWVEDILNHKPSRSKTKPVVDASEQKKQKTYALVRGLQTSLQQARSAWVEALNTNPSSRQKTAATKVSASEVNDLVRKMQVEFDVWNRWAVLAAEDNTAILFPNEHQAVEQLKQDFLKEAWKAFDQSNRLGQEKILRALVKFSSGAYLNELEVKNLAGFQNGYSLVDDGYGSYEVRRPHKNAVDEVVCMPFSRTQENEKQCMVLRVTAPLEDYTDAGLASFIKDHTDATFLLKLKSFLDPLPETEQGPALMQIFKPWLTRFQNDELVAFPWAASLYPVIGNRERFIKEIGEFTYIQGLCLKQPLVKDGLAHRYLEALRLDTLRGLLEDENRAHSCSDALLEMDRSGWSVQGQSPSKAILGVQELEALLKNPVIQERIEKELKNPDQFFSLIKQLHRVFGAESKLADWILNSENMTPFFKGLEKEIKAGQPILSPHFKNWPDSLKGKFFEGLVDYKASVLIDWVNQKVSPASKSTSTSKKLPNGVVRVPRPAAGHAGHFRLAPLPHEEEAISIPDLCLWTLKTLWKKDPELLAAPQPPSKKPWASILIQALPAKEKVVWQNKWLGKTLKEAPSTASGVVKKKRL